mgnify:CR=1 FL=1
MQNARNIMQMCHGLVDLSKFEKTERENIYNPNGQLLGNFPVYFNGFDFIELYPHIEEMFYSGEYSTKTNNFENRILELSKSNYWIDVFELIDKRIGLTQYLARFDKIPDNQKYDAFIAIYQRSEFGFEILKNHYEKILSFAHFSRARTKRLLKLKKKTKNKPFKIHHGVSYNYPVYDYYSWTLKEVTASFFAFRYSSFGEILERKINVENAIDYLDDRNEEEILFLPPKILVDTILSQTIE